MRKYLGAIGVALVAGVLALPGAALAETVEPRPIPADLVGADGKVVTVPIRAGGTAPVTLGVSGNGIAPVKGAVVQVHVLNDLDLPRTFGNCWYYVDSNLDGAWCRVEQTIDVHGFYRLAGFEVAATPDATADRVGSVITQWYGPEYGADRGGIEGLAKASDRGGAAPVRGTGTTLSLEPVEKLSATPGRAIGLAYLRLVSPTTSPTATSAPATTSAARPDQQGEGQPGEGQQGQGEDGRGEGGGLALTGSKSAVLAGAGVLLVGLGFVGFLVARRRTRFVA
ncbi:hypothetical protein GCM10010172_46880 [Paractinoplanes ferrugineus]|uniref:Gram-positive cocci surface proteins LPxTG domain-containing protein n=1 Tax=Paractinoplanes ferrugineus TaxID=113564 RepID=A0A919IYK1_9ACTN|nr:hypothetical protein [Actinoplanes ferrugineus]GIE10272.1 hypothetical protein Afe05nite_21120 [Actinoplanes ferrugineus]